MNNQQKRTLSGSTEIYADIVDLPSSDNAVRINGVKGTAGQVLKKNNTSNKIEWGSEQSITATVPIDVTDNVVSLNTDMGSKSLTTTGTLTAEQLTSTDDITSAGDMICNGNITGDDATNISRINNVLAVSLTSTNNILCGGVFNGNNDGTTTNLAYINNITAGGLINTATLTASGNITANGNIVGDDATTITRVNSISLVNQHSELDTNGGDLTLNTGDILSAGVVNCASIISAGNIGCATIVSTGNITSNGDFKGQVDGTTNINLIGSITMYPENNDNSAFVGNAYSGKKTHFTNCDFTSATNNTALASTITTDHTFSGDITFSGKQKEMSATPTEMDYDFLVNRITREWSAVASYGYQDFYDNTLSGHHYDFQSARTYFADNNILGYRCIKLHPTDFKCNDDSTDGDSILDTLGGGGITATGYGLDGGLIINNVNHEVWTYLDIPEGMMLEGIYLRVYQNVTTPVGLARLLQVWKKPIDYHARDNTRVINLINENLETSHAHTRIPNYVGGGTLSTGSTIYPQDRISSFNTSMMIRVSMTSSTDVLTGGYAICRPISQTLLRWKLTITKSSNFEANWYLRIHNNGIYQTINIQGGSGTEIIYLKYNYGLNDFFTYYIYSPDYYYYTIDGTTNVLVGDGTQATYPNTELAEGLHPFVMRMVRQEGALTVNQES